MMNNRLRPVFCLLTIWFALATNVQAGLPVPFYMGGQEPYGCYPPVNWQPNDSRLQACKNMLNSYKNHWASHCPSMFSNDIFSSQTYEMLGDPWGNCLMEMVATFRPNITNVPTYILRENFGYLHIRYYCPGIDKKPVTYADWMNMEGRLSDVECPAPCPVEPLKPITDPDAIRFENGDNVRIDRLSVNTQGRLQCLRNAIAIERPPGSIVVTSAWRPQAYQDHLKEIVDKIVLINSRDNKKIPACAPIRANLEAEKLRHGLRTLVGRTSNHTPGNAFDATWSGVTTARLDLLASQCGLTRPFPANDPVHFQ
jgi:hypothetical protein